MFLPEHYSLDVVVVSVVDVVDALGLVEVVVEDDPTLLDDYGLDVRVEQEYEVRHLWHKEGCLTADLSFKTFMAAINSTS